MGQGVWTLTLVLGVAGFLCFVEEVGSKRKCPQPPQTGYPVNKNLLPYPHIFVLCLYMQQVAGLPRLPGYMMAKKGSNIETGIGDPGILSYQFVRESAVS